MVVPSRGSEIIWLLSSTRGPNIGRPDGPTKGLCRPSTGRRTLWAMTDRATLEALSSQDLHDRAVRLAEHRMDVGFLWTLVKSIPAAEAAAGNLAEAKADIGVGDLVPL